MGKKSFILFLDSLAILDKMPDEFAGKWIKIITNFQINGMLPDMDFAMEMAVIPFINQFKRDAINYDLTCETNKENGLKGGRPKGSINIKPKEPNGLINNPNNPLKAKKAYKDTDTDNETDTDTDNETIFSFDKEKGVKKFETPTPNEISIYLLEKYPDGNFNGANLFAEKFWSFYENNGWKVGKHKMKNWKLAIASWSDTLQKDLFPSNSGNPKTLNNDYENSKLKRLTDQKEEGRLLIEKLYADKHSNQ